MVGNTDIAGLGDIVYFFFIILLQKNNLMDRIVNYQTRLQVGFAMAM